MLEIKGQHNTAKIFIDTVEQSAISQIYKLCNLESLTDSKIRIMPDCHSGKGCVIGTTLTIHDAVIPNLVGVDIGCGMLAVKLNETDIDLPKFDRIVHEYIPAGSNTHDKPITENRLLKSLACYHHAIRDNLANCSLGTLGGGNHFIELDRDSGGYIWLVIHTGSRHLGIEVCDYYQKQAYKALIQKHNDTVVQPEKQAVIAKLKAAGKQREIPNALDKIGQKYAKWTPGIRADLAACTGNLKDDYLHDMRITQMHASINRQIIAEQIIKHMGLTNTEIFETTHNYIDLVDMVLRKGAISAKTGQKMLIPLNMRDGSLICTGKSNPDWNCSAPHGAGRLYSRSDVKARFSIDEYQTAMQNVYTTSVNQSTLDECPMAYKPAQQIIDAISDTANIIDHLTPIYNFKA